ncbi:MAG: hypothetical protein QNJ51_26915 [Calothrix sp. MO_167.B12]|nr:hypothetical protein [Calothrix sp. MO_167.B12]
MESIQNFQLYRTDAIVTIGDWCVRLQCRDVALQRLYVQIFSQHHATAMMRAENLHRILPPLKKKYAGLSMESIQNFQLNPIHLEIWSFHVGGVVRVSVA